MFFSPFNESILKKAQEKQLIKIILHNLRDYTDDPHRTVDGYSYGGGSGMVMKAEPFYKAIQDISKKAPSKPEVIMMTPQGEPFTQSIAKELAEKESLIILCGRYEGVDERITSFLDREISIGDYVLTGGEIPAMVLVDVVSRCIPGVVGKQESVENDSFFSKKLDYPHYTRPRDFRNLKVPDVLLSGDHKKIDAWRKTEALIRTLKKRPDLIEQLSEEEKKILKELPENIV